MGKYETEADLVLAFLSENHDKAFTKPEIVKGVDFGEGYEPDSILKQLMTLPDELVGVAGTLTASEMVDDDIADALEALVAEGTVDRKEIERDDGETVTYYRLAEA